MEGELAGVAAAVAVVVGFGGGVDGRCGGGVEGCGGVGVGVEVGGAVGEEGWVVGFVDAGGGGGTHFRVVRPVLVCLA